MVTGARGRELVTKPAKASGRKVRGLESIGTLLNPSIAANDAGEQSTSGKPSKKKVDKTSSTKAVTNSQAFTPNQAEKTLFTESVRRPSGKRLAADRAVVAGEEKKDCGLCLVCGNPVEASCGTWIVLEKDGSGQDVEMERYTCSVECEKEKKAQPGLLGNAEIKWKKVTHF
jgi:hypothetical protein